MRPLEALSFLALRRIAAIIQIHSHIYLFHLSHLDDSGKKIGNFGWNILS